MKAIVLIFNLVFVYGAKLAFDLKQNLSTSMVTKNDHFTLEAINDYNRSVIEHRNILYPELLDTNHGETEEELDFDENEILDDEEGSFNTGGGLQQLIKLNDERFSKYFPEEIFDETTGKDDEIDMPKILNSGEDVTNLTLIRIRREYIRMPSNKSYNIPPPKPRRRSCWNTQSYLKDIEPYGRTWREYNIISHEMDNTIVPHAGYNFTKYNIIKIQKIINGCIWKQFRVKQEEVKKEAGKVNQRMLFHGSVAADDIATHGFNEQYSSTNGMFGAGLYFAGHSSKANQYVFGQAWATGCPTHKEMNCKICERKLILARVILGRIKYLRHSVNYSHAPVRYHSVVGVPTEGVLKYPEYVVYRREQAYPEYLVTYKLA